MNGRKNLQNLKNLNKIKSFGVDTNIFIYHLNHVSPFHDSSDHFFEFIEKESKKLFTSTLTLAEILSFNSAPQQLRLLKEALYEMPYLDIVDLTSHVAVEAGRIRRKYRFGLSDSIQIATAIVKNAECFLTNDKKLKSFKEIPVLLLSESGGFK